MLKNCKRFEEFKFQLKNWRAQNPNTVQLDCGLVFAAKPQVCGSFLISEVPELSSIRISLHSNTRWGSLNKLLVSDLGDFIIVPPQQPYKYWRFHFNDTHNYQNDEKSDEFYSYLK